MPNPSKIRQHLKDIRKPHERLAFGEFHAARFTATRVPQKQACSKMGIHRTTYLRTVNRVLRKMELKSVEELVAYQQKHGVF